MGHFEVGGVGHSGPEGVGGLDQLQLVVVPEHGEHGRRILEKPQDDQVEPELNNFSWQQLFDFFKRGSTDLLWMFLLQITLVLTGVLGDSPPW